MINHVGPSPNCGHYTSIGEAANGTFYRFDDASVHPASLQPALHTSAYVIFYEMTKPSRDAVLTTGGVKKSLEITKQPPASKLIGPSLPSGSNSTNSPRIIGPSLPSSGASLPSASPSSPLIGPKLPPQPKNRPAMISEPTKSKPPASPQPSMPILTSKSPTASKLLASPLVKPKVPVEQKAKPQPVAAGGLVPYGSDSDDSDEASSTKSSTNKPSVNGIKPSSTPQTEVKPASSVKPTVASPFLARSVAANLKKLQEAVKEVVVEKAKEPLLSSEALYSPSSKMMTSSRNEFTVTDLDAHNPSVHSDNSTGSTTSFTVTDITSRDSSTASRNNRGEGSVTSRQRWRVSPTPTSTS